MKKRLVSTIITATLLTTTILPTMSVSAEPDYSRGIEFDKDTQNKYSEIQGRYNDLIEKVQELDDQISTLICKINDNDNEIENVNKEIENTNKEIEQKKQDIADQEEVLGKRLREIYKSGGQSNYISLLFSADSFSDLIGKIDDAAKLINLDKKVVSDLNASKKKLDDSVDSLQSKAKEIEDLNNQIQDQKSELDSKKQQQQSVAEEVKAQKDKFENENLVPMETSIASPWIKQATDSNKSTDEIKTAVEMLSSALSQTKSDSVKAQIQNAIDTGNKLINQKKEEQAKAAAASKSKETSSSVNRVNSSKPDTATTVSGDAGSLISYARRFIGVPYVWGGTSPSGFDCSGFTQYVYSHAAGISLGRTTYEQINNGVEVSQSDLKPGDLIFPHEGHVGIYVGNGQMIHAPHTGASVKIAPVYGFWRARRIIG